jgi:hypothetical protein
VSTRIDVLLWAQRVIARKGSAPHVLLEIHEDSTADQVQRAFHKIARTSHPDLHRHGLTPDELEQVTSAYAAVAGAYQQMRSQTMGTVRMKPLKAEDLVAEPKPVTPAGGVRTASATPPGGARTVQAPASVPDSGPSSAVNAAQAMSSQALLYYRKAETCLKRGDLKGAILQLKLACATDPTSVFLRTALAEVETEVRSKP